MVRIQAEVICCMFLMAALGVDLTQNLVKYNKRWLGVLKVNEHEAKGVQGQGPSNITLSQFVFFFEVYRAS